MQPESPLPPAAVVPHGIVAQRRKSFSDQAVAAASQRAPFVPELPFDNVTSAGYVKNIAQNLSSAANSACLPEASHAPPSSNRRLSAAVLQHPDFLNPNLGGFPSASEPSTIFAPNLTLQQPAAARSSGPVECCDIQPRPAAADASVDPRYNSFSMVSLLHIPLLLVSDPHFPHLQLEELSHSNVKEFFIQIVDMMDSRSVQARSMAMVSLCNFLSKGKGREKINVDELSVLLPKFLRFLPADRSAAMSEADTYLAGFPCDLHLFVHRVWLIFVLGATAGTICNLCSSSIIRKQCCDTGYLGNLVALIYQNDVFSSRHAIGALWNLVVDNNDAKIALASDEAFCKKMVELFRHSDIQVLRTYRARALSP
jgi:hypothetical protein